VAQVFGQGLDVAPIMEQGAGEVMPQGVAAVLPPGWDASLAQRRPPGRGVEPVLVQIAGDLELLCMGVSFQAQDTRIAAELRIRDYLEPPPAAIVILCIHGLSRSGDCPSWSVSTSCRPRT
jgi:hypothetical protein